jgi:hypothetical protein
MNGWEVLGWVGIVCLALIMLGIAGGLAVVIVKAAVLSGSKTTTKTTNVFRGDGS